MSFWTNAQLAILRRLREGFLQGTAGDADYWKSQEELALYDQTFAKRIGWKWDAVLGELELRGWQPQGTRLVDLGCGTGIASRRVLEHWKDFSGEVVLMDRSGLARGFAAEAIRQRAPQCSVRTANISEIDCEGALVLLSHVITELDAKALSLWLERLSRAAGFLWVESATHGASRRLIAEVRERFLKSGQWTVVGPCTHRSACPMLREENEAHWCHHFARVPSEAHQDPAMGALSKELGVDLRVLPYSFLVMERLALQTTDDKGDSLGGGAARLIGRPREFKGYHRVLSCEKEGLFDRIVQKRDVPELYRRLRKESGVPLFRFTTEGQRICAGESLFVSPESDDS